MKRLFSILMALVFALTACGGTTSTKKDTIAMYMGMKYESFDPTSGVPYTADIPANVFVNLCKYGEDGKPAAYLAESWDDNDDSVTFHLRKDAKFSDGSNITADDVIYTIDRYMEKPMYAQYYAFISAWEKIDDYTVKVTKSAVYIDVANLFAYTFSVVPKAVHEKDPAAYDKLPSVVSGAYKIDSIEADGTVKLVANENFFEPAKIKKATLKPPVDPSTAAVALENGEVDILMGVSVELLDVLGKNKNVEIQTESGYSNRIVTFTGDELKEDMNLRIAMFHAINTSNIILVANGGLGQPASTMLPARLAADYQNTFDFVGYDEALAKDYMSKSNYDGKRVFTITVGNPLDSIIAQSIQADLKKIGIQTEIETLDVNGWATKLLSGQLEINIQSFYAISASPEDFSLFASTAPYYGMYMDIPPRMDELVNSLMTDTSKDARRAYAQECAKIMYERAIVVPLYDNTNSCAHSTGITSISPIQIATGSLRLSTIDFK